MEKVSVEPEYASPDEAATALAALAPADRIRLEKIARNRLQGPSNAWEDLLQEAIRRILEGTRKWPRNVSLIVFVAEVMRSLASDYRRQQQQFRPDDPAKELISGNPVLTEKLKRGLR